MQMNLPAAVLEILKKLNDAGVDAYAVGGCVRDMLMGDAPKDYDICAGTTPEHICAIFDGYRLIKTGLQHGTVTVVIEGQNFEVTAFRVDGAYLDGRHPVGVTFCKDVRADLARRDFTINAMAYHPDTGLIDPFGGQNDLQKGILRAVGEPELRFTEDALRILRLLRFAARYGFAVEETTAQAALKLRAGLDRIAKERIFTELKGILLGDHVTKVLLDFAPILFRIIPELAATLDFPQNTPYHKYDVWRHTVTAVGAAKPDIAVRLAMLLHDVAKPACFTQKDGVAHFYGHPTVSAQIADGVLARMKSDRALQERVVRLVQYHDTHLPRTETAVKRWLNRLGEEEFFLLMDCQAADGAAKSDTHKIEQAEEVADLRRIAEKVLADAACFKLSDLAVGGKELIELGMKPGCAIGQMLSELLDEVIEGNIENEKTVLLNRAKEKMG